MKFPECKVIDVLDTEEESMSSVEEILAKISRCRESLKETLGDPPVHFLERADHVAVFLRSPEDPLRAHIMNIYPMYPQGHNDLVNGLMLAGIEIN